MKYLLMLLSLTSLNAFSAEQTLLACSTMGDAVGAVDVIIKEDKSAVIRVTQLDDSAPTEYIINFGLKDLQNKKKVSATITGVENDGIAFGGAYSKAAMMRILDGHKTARLAAKDSVYILQCNLK